MVPGFVLLLVFQLAGSWLAAETGWAIPGPVLGMVLLAFGLLLIRRVPAGLRSVSQGLLKHLALLYVPAGVGLMMHLDLIRQQAVALLLILTVSTVLALVVTGWTYQKLARHD